jgi:endonuclease/exonuclease/phosphatase family metal-dependent hydrolase
MWKRGRVRGVALDGGGLDNLSMKMMTYNIMEGGTGRVDPLAEVIRLAGAEVVILQETWDMELFHKLADRLGMDRFLAENPRNVEGAVGVLSRRAITQAVNHAALDERLTRGALTLFIEGLPPLLGVHLHAKETLADEAVRLKELDALLEITASLGPSHILGGDFNTSHPLQEIDIEKLRPKARERIRDQEDRLPREVVSRLLAAGYLDAHGLHHAPANFDVSLTTSRPAMRVDYFFITADLGARVKSCEVFKPEIGRFASDHYPVVMELG